MKYALINSEGSVDRICSNIDPATGTKAGWKWVPFRVVTATCGPDQVREPDKLVIREDGVVRRQIVRDMTAVELEQRAARERQEYLRSLCTGKHIVLVRALLGEVRGKPLTDEEWRAWVEGVVGA